MYFSQEQLCWRNLLAYVEWDPQITMTELINCLIEWNTKPSLRLFLKVHKLDQLHICSWCLKNPRSRLLQPLLDVVNTVFACSNRQCSVNILCSTKQQCNWMSVTMLIKTSNNSNREHQLHLLSMPQARETCGVHSHFWPGQCRPPTVTVSICLPQVRHVLAVIHSHSCHQHCT